VVRDPIDEQTLDAGKPVDQHLAVPIKQLGARRGPPPGGEEGAQRVELVSHLVTIGGEIPQLVVDEPPGPLPVLAEDHGQGDVAVGRALGLVVLRARCRASTASRWVRRKPMAPCRGSLRGAPLP
jgi:hypothetical protein